MNTFATVSELTAHPDYVNKKAFVCKMPFSEYRKAPGYSQSGIKDFLKLPALYRLRQTQPSEPTKPMILGSYFDARITGDGLEGYAVVNADMRTTVGKQLKELAEQSGRTIISGSDSDDVSRWIESVNLCEPAAEYMIGDFQVCGFAWLDGIPVKGRADILGADFIADLKIVADGSPDGFSRAITDGYDIQAALYKMIFEAAMGKELPFIFIVQEKHDYPATADFTGVYDIGEDDIETAKKLILSTLGDMAHAEFMQSWPGYGAQKLSAKWSRKL